MAECDAPHCPEHDAHLIPEILIALGPLHLGLAECPVEGCEFSIHLRVYLAEPS